MGAGERGFAMAVHGGAWAIPEHLREPHRTGCRRALEIGLEILRNGGSSLDAVQAAVVDLENDETFDAGFGSFLNEDGQVQCDAGIMDGRTLRTGSVAGVIGVRNPIVLARSVLESPHAFIVGPGAHRFAVENGVETCDPQELVSPREREEWLAALSRSGSGARSPESLRALFGDTVGAVARDVDGNLAAATSTGGSPGKPEGRVGDSPIVGTGMFADNLEAAVSTTGHGELIIPLVWSKSAADLVRDGMAAPEAAGEAVRLLERTGARGGLIMVDHQGRVGASWNTPSMAFAYRASRTAGVVEGPPA